MAVMKSGSAICVNIESPEVVRSSNMRAHLKFDLK